MEEEWVIRVTLGQALLLLLAERAVPLAMLRHPPHGIHLALLL